MRKKTIEGLDNQIYEMTQTIACYSGILNDFVKQLQTAVETSYNLTHEKTEEK